MNLSYLPWVKYCSCLLLIFIFNPTIAQGSITIDQVRPLGIAPFYLFFALLTLHLPFALLAFFYAVNAPTYSTQKHRERKMGLGVLWLINGLFLSYFLYQQFYLYPSLILFFIPRDIQK